ncbi:TetR/AcrR family transcriptional regulator, partial [uncultured Pseudoalteromonas sp.]|uniref:TetR/AcrR family transcriptional regulator n=1 Tax=uncultured Pseudoalteromonas sp. TaxID=114053 RepID=UPI00261B2E8A
METNNSVPSRRGRPPKIARSNADTRALLINTGLAVLTEKGFSATGIDLILKSAQVPKGSFYHYFKSKNDFGLALIDAYDSYFQAKLKRHLANDATTPLERIVLFANDAKQGMAKFEFNRGCLIGNLNQELSYLNEAMIALNYIIPQFKKNTGVQKVHVLTLTDGEGAPSVSFGKRA